MSIRRMLVLAALLPLAIACGRSDVLMWGEASGAGGQGSSVSGSGDPTGSGSSSGGLTPNTGPTSGAGGPGSGAGGPGSGAGGPGSGAGGPGSGAGGPGSGAGGPGSGQAGVGGSEMICAPLGDPCTGCISQNCAGDWCDCQGNPECLTLFNCFGACNNDEACNQACMTQHQSGISNVLLVSGCAGTVCDSSCAWGDDEFTECQECIYQDCASEMNACLAAPDCTKLWDCFQGCPPLALSCNQQCYNDFPKGVATLETLLQCTVVACEDPCED